MSSARRESVHSTGPVGPWKATIRIEALRLARARSERPAPETVFEVSADWTGPPGIGFPPSDRPVEAHDVYVIGGDLELARAIARVAEQKLREACEPPNLREIAATVRLRLAQGPYG